MAAARAIHVVPAPRRAPAPRAAILLIGFTAVLAQVLLLREMLVVCHGNELSLGLMLAAWLAWTALGSGLLGRLGRASRLLPLLFAVTAAALPLALLAVRHARAWWDAAPGEMLGPVPILLTAAIALACFCPISGWLIAAAMRSGADRQPPASVAARVYLLEALGSALGGLVAALLLLRRFSPLEIAAALAAFNLLAAVFLLSRARIVRLAATAVLLPSLVFSLPRLRAAELAAVARDWPGFRVLAAQASRYGRLAVLDNEGVATVVQNGQPLFSAPDLPTAEETVHFALLQHPEPRAVLLIGGGPSGAIAEILKHPSVRRLDYIELDPAVLDLSRRYLPQQSAPLADPRVHTHSLDGRLFLRTATGRYDVILASLPDPQTAQLNRFYTLEFFREAAAHLASGGVLSLQVHGAENYVSPELARFLASLRRTLAAVFPRVVVLPGDTVHFFAGDSSAQLTSDPAEFSRRLHERGVSALYVRGYYTAFNLSPERLRGFDGRLAAVPATALNRDFAPSAYYFGVMLWSEQFGNAYRDLFRALAGVPLLRLLALVLVFAALLAIAARPRRAELGRPAAYAVALMGFTLMALQILLLLGFQAVYGYVFEQVAILAAACMAGLGLGSWCALKLVPARWPLARPLLALQIVAAAAPLVFVGILQLTAGARSGLFIALAAYVLFPLLALLSGAMAGLQFPLALRAFLEAAPRRAGTLYALDLLGSCAGALLLSTYLIPVFGFAATAALITAANVPLIVLLLLSSRVPRLAPH